LVFAKKESKNIFFDLFLKESLKKISNRKSRNFGTYRNLFTFLKDYHFTHRYREFSSSGNRPSASGMAALAMNFMSLEKN
jgi:diphosphomevalonate decarboxylase